jgi:hypothetical protein
MKIETLIKKEILIASVFIFVSLFSHSQEYPRYIVKKLASPEMEGRGYVNSGSDKAAVFIANQFDSLGLSSFDGSYYQDFELLANTFPGKLSLRINNQLLEPGVDYLVDPASGGGNAENYSIKTINIFKAKQLQKLIDEINSLVNTVLLITLPDTLSQKGNMMFMQTVYLLCEQWPVILLNSEKLTWSISNREMRNPLFIVKDFKISKRDKISFSVDQKLEIFQEQNVVSIRKGNSKSGRYLVISAHYDHLGRMGSDTYFPGANDNASGVAEMLLLKTALDAYTIEHSILFIAFAGEEAGLKGSQFFVDNPLVPLDSIDFVLNLDLSGTGEEGITVVNGSEYELEYNELVMLNDSLKAMVEIKKRGPAANSDHHSFYEKGVPSFFIYTRGGIKAYHDVNDKSETLPLNKLENLVELYTSFFLYLDKK